MVQMAINRLWWHLTSQIVSAIGMKSEDTSIGGFAAAMVSGHQAFVSRSLLQSMRNSGLAHILSISGVHMAIVGGFSFFSIRGLLALWPRMAQIIPIKKVSAIMAMIIVVLYLAISGAPAPAVRAALVAEIAFLGIVFDRKALSLRSLAVAAILIITFTPDAVLQPGFQMSFLATAALLGLSEAHQKTLPQLSLPIWAKTLNAAVRGIVASIWASIVATGATLPSAIAFFNKISLYGVASNLLEAPVTGFWVMPGLAIGTGLVETPLGRGILWVSGFGLRWIRTLSDFIAGLPGSVIALGAAEPIAFVISVGGVIWASLVRGFGRWLGVLAGMAILLWPRSEAPDVWVDTRGENLAIRLGHSALVLRPKVKQFGFEQWLVHYNLMALNGRISNAFEKPSENILGKYYDCKNRYCLPLENTSDLPGFYFGKIAPKPEILEALCQSSPIVIIRAQLSKIPEACRHTQILDTVYLGESGALEIRRNRQYRLKKTWSVKSVNSDLGQRPWSARLK